MSVDWTGRSLGFVGFGTYFPKQVVRLADVVTPSGRTLPEHKLLRLGVRTKHVADEETVSDMAVHAARRALEQAGLQGRDIDLVVLSKCTGRWHYTPDLAPLIAERLDATGAYAFDVSAGCAGFLHGTHIAAAQLAVGGHRRALVIAAEQMTTRMQPGTPDALAAGDGACAAVLTTDAQPGRGLLHSLMLSHGEHADALITVPPHGWVQTSPKLYGLAAECQIAAMARILRESGTDLDEVDWILPHPGSNQVRRAVRDHLGPDRRVIDNFETHGNAASASVATALAESVNDGIIGPGDLVLATAAGAGWFSGAMLLRV
ncbi:ketoacyl-ACP synthase III [Micromonospora sp. NPDC050417]|uniref:ketoacyl-ACP synthase III n=1 Tax=Micromonospora sp. NPDC050417 TaxID=3364280 RepID=UPI0037B56546